MSKKLVLVLAVVLFLFSFHLAHASLFINEIMYDLSGSDSTGGKSREWIEIYNSGPSDVSVDASKWRIYEGSGNKTINGGADFSIPSGAYVIWAGNKDTFLSDHAGFSGVVYDTGITSLNNSGATLKILDQDGNAVDTATYTSSMGGAGDGNSLQKIEGKWTGAAPTPGAVNVGMVSPSSTQNGSSGVPLFLSSESNTETKNKVVEEPKIKTKIIGKTYGFAGIPILLEGETHGYNGERLFQGKYFWNFGDGDSKEEKVVDSGKFYHSYFYPGEYTVSLDYYQNYYGEIPDATDQIIIKIIGADVFISKVGDEKDFFIELTNNTDYSVDISNWFLASDKKSFTIPKNTILGAKKKMIISPKISLFSFEDKNSLRLVNKEGGIVFDYNLVRKNTNTPHLDSGRGASVATSISSEIPKEDLLANAVSSVESNGDKNNFFVIIIFIIFIGISAYTVYFVRQKRAVVGDGNDFEILDE